MSAPKPDLGTPILTAAELVAGLGTYPTVTFPARRNRPVDTESLRQYLAEPAEFFGFELPSLPEFDTAIARFAGSVAAASALMAATLTLLDGGRIVVTGRGSASFDPAPVGIGVLDSRWQSAGTDRAHWLQMAARTVSGGTVDQLLRTLRDRECVDGIPEGADITAPLSGALVLDVGAAAVGVSAPGPMSILEQLRGCELLADLPRRSSVSPAEVQRAWWISPQFTTHPVAMLGRRTLPVDPNRPSFLEKP